ncbi:MAG: phage holin family protein [Oscillospiraceae bacterium]|nr:phage holin family protein [Oscillospiraceae bacterium]
MDRITETAKIILGGIIAALTGFLGGMDGIMYALLVFISIDYVTGIMAAAKKKELSSEIGFWGIVKKVCIIALVGVAHFIDMYVMQSGDIFRAAVALYYIGNEGLSLLENIENLGVKLPGKLVDALKRIRDENDKNEGGSESSGRQQQQ